MPTPIQPNHGTPCPPAPKLAQCSAACHRSEGRPALDLKIGHEIAKTRRPHCPASRPSSAFTGWPVTEPSVGCNRSPHAQAVAANDTSSRHFSRPNLPLSAPRRSQLIGSTLAAHAVRDLRQSQRTARKATEWSPDGIIAYVQLSCESEADCGVHRGSKSIDDRILQHRWARQRREIS